MQTCPSKDLSMTTAEFAVFSSVLRSELGPASLPFIFKCLLRSRAVFRASRWSQLKNEEARMARRVSSSVALYLNLTGVVGRERALDITRQIVVPIGTNEQLRNIEAWGIASKSGMERLMAFYDHMGRAGVGRFVERTLVKASDATLRYEVKGCFFHRFYSDAGTPELTQLFCEVDREFFPRAFPDFTFHRGDSWQNTIAYGKDHCTFAFDRIDSAATPGPHLKETHHDRLPVQGT